MAKLMPRALLMATTAVLLLSACSSGTSTTSADNIAILTYKSKSGLDITFVRAGNQVRGLTGSVAVSCDAGDLVTFTYVVPGSFAVSGNAFNGSVSQVISGSKVTWKVQGRFDANGHGHGTYSEDTGVCASGVVPWEADPA